MVVRFEAWKWLLGVTIALGACGGKASDVRESGMAGAPGMGGGSAGGAPQAVAGRGADEPQGRAGSAASGASAGSSSEAGSAGEDAPEIPWPVPPDDPLSQAVTFQNDVQHSGAQLNDTLRLPLEKRWEQVFAGIDGLSYPVVARKRVFVGYRSNSEGLFVTALSSETGERLWTTKLLKASYDGRLTLAYQDERIFAVSGDGLAVALDATGGTEIWRALLARGPHSVDSAPVVVARVLYIAISGELVAVSGSNGAVLWRGTQACTECSPTIVGSTVYVGAPDRTTHAGDGTIYAIDAKDGESLWQVSVPPREPPAAPSAGGSTVIVGQDGKIFFRSQSEFWSLDPVTKQLGSKLATDYAPATAAGWLFGAAPNRIAGMAMGTSPMQEWGYEHFAASAPGVVVGSTVLFVSNSQLVALDRASGTLLSSIALDGEFRLQRFFQYDRAVTGLIAAENKLFVPLVDRLVAY